jgi:hypothetical protein
LYITRTLKIFALPCLANIITTTRKRSKMERSEEGKTVRGREEIKLLMSGGVT